MMCRLLFMLQVLPRLPSLDRPLPCTYSVSLRHIHLRALLLATSLYDRQAA